MIPRLTLVLLIFSVEISGEYCNMGFPEHIVMESTTMELDVLPEDTEIIIPSLRITCDGYISHVSVAYEVSQTATVFNQSSGGGVYLQLWRNNAAAMGTRNYTLVEGVLLPVGSPWTGNDDRSILNNYKLPYRITVQPNDVIGFRTLYDSSVNVLVNMTDQREMLINDYYDNVLNMTGVPLILITHRKTCNKDLPNNINVSTSVKSDFPAESVSGNAQILFPSVKFTCNGVINQITTWYQILAEVSLNVSIIIQSSRLKFQIWHPISSSNYKLVSEATVPSAVDDQPITVDNLHLQFYSGSVVGIYMESNGGRTGTLRLLNDDEIPQSFFLVTDDKPCVFDTASTGVVSFTTIDIEAALDYVVSKEDMDQVFYCQEDDQVAENETNLIITATCIAIALIITIILLILIVTCCWRRYKSLGRTKSHYDFQPAITRNAGNNKSFVSVRYYRLDSNAELLSSPSTERSRSYAIISESGLDTFKTPGSNFKQICSELTEVEISPDEIELGDEIGSGNFGVVYHGVWKHTAGKTNQVAIKTLHGEASEEEKTKLLREAATVQQFLHINIIKFYGIITSKERIMVVLEYLPNGSLLDFLRSVKPKENEPVNRLLPQVLLRFAREIGSGMNYLSNKSFIHRDLAARNILLSEENVCKIADFGLSRDLDEDDYYITHGGLIPVKWTAPEALLFRKYTTASDVWSYGVVLYEMWSLGEKLYENYDNSEISELIGTGYRLPPPPGCARQIYNLMIQCWNPEHRLRPTFAAILKTISQPSYVLFHWFEEDKQAAGPQCDVLGAPLECGHNLYFDLQNAYK